MNYFTQTDDFFKGIVSGVGAWIKDINPFKKVSNSEVKEIGKHTGKLIADVASAIIAGKLVSSFSKSKVGQKIIKKLKMKKGKKTKAPSTSTPKPNNTRINVANGRTRYTPKRANGNYVSVGMEHIISGHFNRALGNSRSILV